PRGAGDRRGDRRVMLRYLIEKTRFSCVWWADDGDHDAVPQPFPPVSVGEMALDLGNQPLGLSEDPILYFGREVLIRKIDGCLEMGEHTRQAPAPAAVEITELTVELVERLAALRLGLGRSEIGDGFGL